MMRRARLAWCIALIVSALVAMAAGGTLVRAQSAKSSLTDPEQAAMFNRISDKLVCQCGCNMILRVCNHFECPSALPMRASIEEQILAGTGEETIIAGFVEEHGQVVLATPPPSGINLAAWVMPGFAVLLGTFLLLYIVSDWIAKRRVRPEFANDTLDPSVTTRIEDEVKGLDV